MNEEIKCKTHPDAPHGFVRNASYMEDRYVCECEYWEEPKVNERIYTLAREAGLIAPYGSDREGLRDFDYRMFAELIVKECMNQVKEQYNPVLEDTEMMKDTHWDGYVHCGVDSYVAIREHFGVEE